MTERVPSCSIKKVKKIIGLEEVKWEEGRGRINEIVVHATYKTNETLPEHADISLTTRTIDFSFGACVREFAEIYRYI